MISHEHMSGLFVEVADTLVDGFDLAGFLSNLVVHAMTVSGADTAGLVLADRTGRLQPMASSDAHGEGLEQAQIQAQEGPCLECFTTGEPVADADLPHAAGRWPTFAPHAAELGYRSVHAFPLRLREQVIGVLDLFGAGDSLLEETDVSVVQALADVATIALVQERTIRRAEQLAEQLQRALTSRVVIEQAKGAVAALDGISTDEAFEVLRRRARSSQRRLEAVAQEVLGESQAPQPPNGTD